MPPFSYPILCYTPHCAKEASYKVAARWSDGLTAELKTYALACAGCLPTLYQAAKERRARCRLTPEETLEVPGIYRLIRGDRDRQLLRCVEMED